MQCFSLHDKASFFLKWIRLLEDLAERRRRAEENFQEGFAEVKSIFVNNKRSGENFMERESGVRGCLF